MMKKLPLALATMLFLMSTTVFAKQIDLVCHKKNGNDKMPLTIDTDSKTAKWGDWHPLKYFKDGPSIYWLITVSKVGLAFQLDTSNLKLSYSQVDSECAEKPHGGCHSSWICSSKISFD